MGKTRQQNGHGVEYFADILREEIKQNVYGKNGYAPSIGELADRWHINRATASQVINRLRVEGILRPKGARMVISWPIIKLEGITENFERFLREQGYDVRIDNIGEPAIEEMPEEIANVFGQPRGIRCVHRVRLQGTADEWLRIAENWYPLELAGQFLDQMRADHKFDVVGAIKRESGLYIVESEDTVFTRIPTPDERRRMELAPYEPMFEIHRLNLTQDGRAVMVNRLVLVGTKFKLRYRYPVHHWK
jgi:GntR family transcriptional regulator